MQDAAKAAKWGRFQAAARRQAQKTAQDQTDKAASAEAESQRLKNMNRQLVEELQEWARTYENGLNGEQLDRLVAHVKLMRQEIELSRKQIVSSSAPRITATEF